MLAMTDEWVKFERAPFDHPEIMEGANGKLISDRPHTFKLFGSWEFAEHFLMSGNALFQSGIPYGAIGCHPDLGAFYGCQFFYDGDELVNRGSRGRTDNVYQLDFGLQYSLMMGKRNSRLVIGVDVINLFDLDSETGVDEYVGDEVGSPNLNYLHTSGFQQPRYVRISARLDF